MTLLVSPQVVDFKVNSWNLTKLDDLRGQVELAKQECAQHSDELAHCYSGTEGELTTMNAQI